MRLIDADRAVAKEEFFAKSFKGDFGEQVALHTIEILNDAPTVDAVPIIWILEYIEQHSASATASEMLHTWRLTERKEE